MNSKSTYKNRNGLSCLENRNNCDPIFSPRNFKYLERNNIHFSNCDMG